MASMEAGSSSYDVFLSFRGDTRWSFTDHLYNALDRARVHTFRDNKIPRGEEISSQLLEAIHGSEISIVVFSEGYATSTWCLEELAYIMECRNTKGQVVIPVFYHIDPSDVQEQKRSFAEAFQTHEERFKEEIEKVNRWRKALREASTLAGFDLNSQANQHEAVFIEDIVEHVRDKLGPTSLDVPKHLVGISSHVENIISLTRFVTDDTSFVNIHGMGGIGKTTIAKAVFNKLHREFEGSCFISNVNEHLKDRVKGLAELRIKILCDTLNSKLYSVLPESLVHIFMKENLSNKRVLVVLDDVVSKEHASLLVGDGKFGPGSVIMVTSRDESLLTGFPVHVRYEAKVLPYDESLKFFSFHAFGTTHPPEDFADISDDIVKYAGGLPLALEVLGSSLYQRNKTVWLSAFEKQRKIPNHQIQQVLQISFDSLDDDIVKGIFLDIACFFGGRNKEYVSAILSARWDHDPESSFSILVDRSLLKVTLQNTLRMHDLVRDMGREIVRQQHPRPGKRSRIWHHKEAWKVLEMNMGAEEVEGLALHVPTLETDRTLTTESFKNMKCLNLLQINGVRLSGCYSHLPRDIIWLCWHGSSLKSLPSTFLLHNLVVLDMQYSNIEKLESLDKLKILNLSHSKFAKTPNLVGLLSLERLILERCKRLAKVDDQSVRHLEKLVHLSLKECKRLNHLPESICNLKYLETLDISGCSRLEKLPDHLGAMESLTELLANETLIMELPSSVGQLTRLRKISLSGCNNKQVSPFSTFLSALFSSRFSPTSSASKAFLPASLNCSSQLTGLDLSYRGLSDGEIFIDLGSLSTLQELNLSGNKFFNMPSGIGRLPMLKYLLVKDCTNLLSVSELPSSLKKLDAVDCSALERLKIQSNKIPSLYVSGCKKLIEIEGMEVMRKRWVIVSEDRRNLSNDLKKSLVQALCKGDEYDIIIAHDGEMPGLFSHRGVGSSLSFHVPPGSDGTNIQGLVVWVVCAAAIGGNICAYLRGEAVVRNKSTGVELFRRSIMLYTVSTNSSNQCSWVSHISLDALPPNAMRAGEELELSAEVKHTYFQVKKCGVHFIIVDKQRVEKTAPFSYPCSFCLLNSLCGLMQLKVLFIRCVKKRIN
ncbi:TMV resistance protein [Salix suchowensis]|nr:TMV resistance protein [Salix suchowensis]